MELCSVGAIHEFPCFRAVREPPLRAEHIRFPVEIYPALTAETASRLHTHGGIRLNPFRIKRPAGF